MRDSEYHSSQADNLAVLQRGSATYCVVCRPVYSTCVEHRQTVHRRSVAISCEEICPNRPSGGRASARTAPNLPRPRTRLCVRRCEQICVAGAGEGAFTLGEEPRSRRFGDWLAFDLLTAEVSEIGRARAGSFRFAANGRAEMSGSSTAGPSAPGAGQRTSQLAGRRSVSADS